MPAMSADWIILGYGGRLRWGGDLRRHFLFKELGVKDFPTMTLVLMNMSHFLTTYWYLAIGIGIALYIAFRMLPNLRI